MGNGQVALYHPLQLSIASAAGSGRLIWPAGRRIGWMMRTFWTACAHIRSRQGIDRPAGRMMPGSIALPHIVPSSNASEAGNGR